MAHGATTQPKCRTCGERHPVGLCGLPTGVSMRPVSRSVERRLAGQPEKTVDRPVDTVSTPPISTLDVSTRSDAERVREWRNANRDRYNAYMRDWRKRKRNEKAAGS